MSVLLKKITSSARRSLRVGHLARRFTCPNTSCGRRTVVERVPGLTPRHGQRTERLRSTLEAELEQVRVDLADAEEVLRCRVIGLEQHLEALAEEEAPAAVAGGPSQNTNTLPGCGLYHGEAEAAWPVSAWPGGEGP
ncbi:hypothetical protein [Streptomyces sp. NPDC058964]|uniref:hypothetical protein n=1 Tax=Streptomyces sp. NPDC058964 TaxID=3346681 RepID=UPI0036A82EF2